jgi:putative transposase
VNQLVSRDVSKLIIGYNQNWKQDINIGKINNQNFSSIPFFKFITMLEYKCKMEGIEVIKHEESYTSKCSFLDMEPMKKHLKYMGKRIKRGLFKSSSGKCLNSDLNGAYNILRKVVPNSIEGIEGIAVCPRLFTV